MWDGRARVTLRNAVAGGNIMRTTIRCAVAALLLVLSAGILSAQDGAAVYRAACASCHDAGLQRAPNRAALALMSPERGFRPRSVGRSMI